MVKAKRKSVRKSVRKSARQPARKSRSKAKAKAKPKSAHLIENAIAAGNRLAFTQSCTYADGTKVFCAAMLDLKGGKIAQHTVIQAWDG